MKIPESIKVGGHTFTISYSELKDATGETVFSDCTIQLDEKALQSIKEATLLHEIFIHTLNTTFTDDENIHATLDGMVEQLYQVLVDNKFCFCREHDNS